MPEIDEFISGHYSLTYGASPNIVDLGTTLDGFNWTISHDLADVTADRYAGSVIDRIWRGIRTMTLRFSLIQMTAAKRNAAMRYFGSDSVMGTQSGARGRPGTLVNAGGVRAPMILDRLNNVTVLPQAPTGFKQYRFWCAPSGDWTNRLNTQSIQAWDATFDVYPTLPGGVLPNGSNLSTGNELSWFQVDST